MNTLTTEKVIQQQKKLHGTRLPKKGKVADSLMVSAMKELLGDLQKLYPELQEYILMLESAAESDHFVRNCILYQD